MKGNYIKIDRKILKWEWYGNVNTKVLFLHCLLKANWQDGRFEGREIKRGSFVTSLKKLSQETGLTVRQVRDALDHLILTGELTSETTNKFRIITVNNYSEYQDIDNQNDNQMTNKRQTTDKQVTTIEEYIKKNKEEKRINNNNKTLCTEPETSSDSMQESVAKIILNDKSYYDICQSDIDNWKELYPAVDVMQEIRNMIGWCDANPTKRKTRRGIKRFINNWLQNTQNRGGNRKTENKESGSITGISYEEFVRRNM